MTQKFNLRKFLAPEFIFGDGSRYLCGRRASNLAIQRALVVTDPGVIAAGWVAEVVSSLEEAEIDCHVFSDVSPNPRMAQVAAGAQAYREHDADGIVAVGGGSPMDCAKAIGIVASGGRPIAEFAGIDKVDASVPPLICVPTTSGSAAEVSQFSIITNEIRRMKMAIISKSIVPDLALVDPETLSTMDPYLSACTGVDALVHSMEAFVSTGASPFTATHAKEAALLVFEFLPRLIDDRSDAEARSEVMRASLIAGLAFSNASLGANHALSHSLGGRFDLAHGECNAILLPHIFDFNYPEAQEVYDAFAPSCGLILRGKTQQERRVEWLDHINGFLEQCELRATLSDRGVKSGDFQELAQGAAGDACLLTNPRRANVRDIEFIYEQAL